MIRGMKNRFAIISAFFTFLLIPKVSVAAASFSTVFGGTCDSYECWIKKAWGWSMGILIPLSVLIFTAAGVIYMTSEGDSNRIGVAKKMILGVLSGVGLLILGRLLLIVIFGDASTGGWEF